MVSTARARASGPPEWYWLFTFCAAMELKRSNGPTFVSRGMFSTRTLDPSTLTSMTVSVFGGCTSPVR